MYAGNILVVPVASLNVIFAADCAVDVAAKDTLPVSWSTENASPTRKSPSWSVEENRTLPPFSSSTSLF